MRPSGDANAVPELPPAFALRRVERVDCAATQAALLARDGAEEGTLVWATEVERSPGLDGAVASGQAGNLYCAVVIRPDCPRSELEQLALVAVVAAGAAIASVLEPMTGLRYHWPGIVLVNSLPTARVWLELPADAGDVPPWAVLGLTVRVEEYPDRDFPQFNSVHASGAREVTPAQVLAAWSRQFLSWADRWAATGFAPVQRAWSLRADGMGEAHPLEIDGVVRIGEMLELADDGRLRVRVGANEHLVGFTESASGSALAAR